MSELKPNRTFDLSLYKNDNVIQLLTEYNECIKEINRKENIYLKIKNQKQIIDEMKTYDQNINIHGEIIKDHENFLAVVQKLEIEYFEKEKELDQHRLDRVYHGSRSKSFWKTEEGTNKKSVVNDAFYFLTIIIPISTIPAFAFGILISSFVFYPIIPLLAILISLAVALSVVLIVEAAMVYQYQQIQHDHQNKFNDESRNVIELEITVPKLRSVLNDITLDTSLAHRNSGTSNSFFKQVPSNHQPHNDSEDPASKQKSELNHSLSVTTLAPSL
jgi:hypothetical protein